MPRTPDDKIISIKSRQPYEADEDTVIEPDAEEIANRNILANLLETYAGHARSGRLDSFVLVGRDPVTGLFFNEIMLLEPNVTRTDLFAYVGALEGVRSEVNDNAFMAPIVNADLTITDPYDDSELESDA